MDLTQILRELQEERDQLTAAILTLEQMAANHGGARRGRKPKWLAEAAAAPTKRRGRPPGSKNKSKAND